MEGILKIQFKSIGGKEITDSLDLLLIEKSVKKVMDKLAKSLQKEYFPKYLIKTEITCEVQR